MKRPSSSSPRRVKYVASNPKRERPIATLTSAPETVRVYLSTSSKEPSLSATKSAIASPSSKTSLIVYSCLYFFCISVEPRFINCVGSSTNFG